jgi:hypothetical protein
MQDLCRISQPIDFEGFSEHGVAHQHEIFVHSDGIVKNSDEVAHSTVLMPMVDKSLSIPARS